MESDFDKIYHEGFMTLGLKYLTFFKNGIFQIEDLRKGSKREILVTIYYEMLKKKTIIPIEQIPENQKSEIKQIINQIGKGLSKTEKVRIAKAAWALNTIAKLAEESSGNFQCLDKKQGWG